MSELTDARALLKRSASCLLAALDDVEEPTLVKPTPCPEWDVHDLVLHVADAADELTSRATGSPAPRRSATSPVALARERVLHLLEVTAEEPATSDQASSIIEAALGGTIELAAHAWDLSSATNGPRLPLDHAADVLALAQRLVDDEARAAFFGPIVETGADASARDQLAAFLGRDPAWVTRTHPL